MKIKQTYNLLKNIKIKGALYLILTVSITSFLLLGAFAYYSINHIKSLQNDMYLNSLIPISQVAEIKSNLIESKLNITKANYVGFKKEYVVKIDKIDMEVNGLIKKYENRLLDPKEKVYIDKVKSTYEIYSNNWKLIKVKLQVGMKLTNEDVKTFDSISENVDSAVDDMITYGKNDAIKLRAQSNLKVVNSSRVFLYILILLTLVLISLVTIIINSIKNSIKDFVLYLNVISDGDFTLQSDNDSNSELGIMKKQLKAAIDKIKNMIQSIGSTSNTVLKQSNLLLESSSEISNSLKEVSDVIQEVASGAEKQAMNLANVNNYVGDFGKKVTEIVTLIEEVTKNVQTIDQRATDGNESFKLMVGSVTQVKASFIDVSKRISELGDNINEINEITVLINNIAGQTNLLALNAAIEAARAGESGKGFAVVADEIRKLAEQSKVSSNKIGELIKNITEESNIVVKTTDSMENELNNQDKVIKESITSFESIISSINDVTPKVEKINTMSIEVNKDKNIISTKVDEVALVASEISASTEEISATTQEISSFTDKIAKSSKILDLSSNEMIEKVSRFKIE